MILYGAMPSRAFRCMWMLEEAGVVYKWQRVLPSQLCSPPWDGLNPNRKIPVLQDGELTLWESLAINIYVAQTYAPALWPVRSHERARVLQWSFWAVNEIEQDLVPLLVDGGPSDCARLLLPLQVLDDVLAQQSYLLGANVTAADINVAGILSSIFRTGMAARVPVNVRRWLESCLARPFPRRFFRPAASCD